MLDRWFKKEKPLQGLTGMGGGVVRFGGAGGVEYWIAESRDGSVNAYGQHIDVNANGDIAVSAAPDPGNYVTELYDKDGTQYWSKEMTSKGYGYANALLDSSGNVYNFGQRGGIKYSSGGSLQWNKFITAQGGNIAAINHAEKDSSNNFYLASSAESGSGGIYKIDSSGSLTAARRMQNSNQFNDVHVDSSGNVYATSSGDNDDVIILKMDSSFATTWVRKFGNYGDNFYSNCIAADSSGNVYAAGSGNMTNGKWFVKFNSSGTIQWQKTWNGTNIEDIHIDGNDNIYTTGAFSSIANITKWNSDGTVNFSRSIARADSSNEKGFGINTDSDGKILLTGLIKPGGGSDTLFLAKLPNDGSLNGTYGNYTISDYSFPTISDTSHTVFTSFTYNNQDKTSVCSIADDSNGSVANSNWTYSFQEIA